MLTVATLQELLAMTHNNEKIKQLIWDSAAAYKQLVSKDEIHGFQEQLLDWESRHTNLLPDLSVAIDTGEPFGNDWKTYPLPPKAYRTMSLDARLAAAHYNFYMARMKWALCILNEDPEDNERSAYSFFYKAMRLTVTQSEEPNDNNSLGDTQCPNSYSPPEALKIGFLPLLHITGLCSPQPSWLQWIRDTCALLQQEGVFKGHTFSTNLDCFHAFELHSKRNLPSTSDRYPAPASRVICHLIPEPDGRHFVSYFARARYSDDSSSDVPNKRSLLGHAWWRCYQGERPCNPELHMYGEEPCVPDLWEWLSSRPGVAAWREWATHTEFDMQRALRDHINGARLLSSPEDVRHRHG